jgi:hypothetical protein
MTMALWADYSAGRPSGAALKAAGFGGVIRYIGLGTSGKRINADEYKDLVAAGVQVLLVAELGTGDAWGTSSDDDYARGRANATAALNDARACGIPDSVGIAAAADAHAGNSQQITDAVAYTRGFRDVLGLGRTGFYGFSETLSAVHAAGVASWFWRCGSEPSEADAAWIHFWQRNTAPTIRVVSGIQCDINEQYHPPGGDDMFDQADRDTLNLLKAVVADRRPSLVDPTASFDTGEFVRFIDASTNATQKTVVAQNATIATLAAAVANQHGWNADDLKAAIQEAIKTAVVTVAVNVAGQQVTVPAAPAV